MERKMKHLAVTFAIFFASAAGATTSSIDPSKSMSAETAKNFLEGSFEVAVLCFAKGEQVSGMNKICYYDCLGSLTAITISSAALCPLTINN
jgi:hypothetical protein